MSLTLTFLLRILAASLLGGAIGIERGYRAKEAGFRTHFLVALGAALFMVLSAHGFDDVVFTESHRLDVSRIAAQVVSGIGFIGAGTIIFQRQMVHGLTTAAGLWVTAAIGMTAGAGLYVIAVAATVLVLLGLEVLNSLLPQLGHRPLAVTFTAHDQEQVREVLACLKKDGTAIGSYNCTEAAQKRLRVRLELRPSRSNYSDRLMTLITEIEGIELEILE